MLTPAKELLLEELLSILVRVAKFSNIAACSHLIFEFIEKYLCDPLLRSIIDALLQEWLNDCAPLNAMFNEMAPKIWLACEDGEAYVEKKGIKNPAIVEKLAYFKGRDLNTTRIYLQHHKFVRFLVALLMDSIVTHRDFIEKYALINENSFKITVKPFLSLDKIDREMSYLSRIKKAKAWFSLGELVKFCSVYNTKLYEEFKKMLKVEGPVGELISHARFNDLNCVINSAIHSQSCEDTPDVNCYSDHMERLYFYTKKGWSLDDAVPLKKKLRLQKIYLKWKPEKLCLALNGQIVSHNFKPKKSPVKLLNLFIKEGKFTRNVPLVRIFNCVHNSTEKTLDEKQEKSARGYVRELNEIFPIEYQRDENIFLEIDNKIVNPNSIYLLES